ncbi:ankyrin, partial [Imleria badia]
MDTVHEDEALETTKLLIARGCDPLQANSCGDTPLHIAVQRGHVSVRAKFLFAHGCDPLRANSYGETPLRIAVSTGCISVARYLLSFGAPPSSVEANTFISLCKEDTQMMRFLIENGFNALSRTASGDSLLHIVTRDLRGLDALEMTKFLIAHDCDPLQANSRGETPICSAIEL